MSTNDAAAKGREVDALRASIEQMLASTWLLANEPLPDDCADVLLSACKELRNYRALLAENARLRIELEAARKDVERYRWLRHGGVVGGGIGGAGSVVGGGIGAVGGAVGGADCCAGWWTRRLTPELSGICAARKRHERRRCWRRECPLE